MPQTRNVGVNDYTNSSGLPGIIAANGAMPEDPRNPGVAGASADASFLYCLPMTCMLARAPSGTLANNIATTQTTSSGVAMTITAGTGITSGVFPGTFSGGPTGTTGVFFIDGVPTANPQTQYTTNIARNVKISASGNDVFAFTVTGYDIYGNLQTGVITSASGSTVSGTKCFKAILSVVPANSSASGIQVGTGDLYAFPMRVDNFDEVLIYWSGALITSSTGFSAASSVSPQTSSTAEPKGAYQTQTSSNGTNRLVFYQLPKSLQSAVSTFGVTPA